MLVALMAALALAGDTTSPVPENPQETKTDWAWEPYWQPILNIGAVRVNGNVILQTTAGAEVGLRYMNAEVTPNWVGRTRLRGAYTWGVGSGSQGIDGRLGSFIGPHWKWFTTQHGPDVWYNFYGSTRSIDYYLEPTGGVTFTNTLIVQPHEYVAFLASADPGWVFNPDRQATDLGPFHELELLAAVVLRLPFFQITFGYRWQKNAFGVQDGLILSGGY